MPPARLSKIELLLLVACAAILATQLFVPPVVGLADNGDFSRVYARFSLAHVRGDDDNFAYFSPRYWFAPETYWYDHGLSSEMAIAAGPIFAARLLRTGVFDIRWVGVVHALLFLAAYLALLLYLRRWSGWPQLVLGAAALWIFGDVAYVAYCNSFYWDTAALAGVMLMVPLALRVVSGARSPEGTLLLFAAAALLFIASKPQHAVVGLIPAAIAARVLRRTVLAALLVCALWVVVAWSPAAFRAKPLFGLIFHKITFKSTTPGQDLAQLGLDDRYLPYVGMQTGSPGSPAQDDRWLTEFVSRTGYGRVALFYLRHPVRMVRTMAGDLHMVAFQIRPHDLGNYRRSEGFPPGTIAHTFSSWSNLRSTLFIRWWPHIVLWYALFGAFALRLARRSAAARIALGVVAMAVAEFVFNSLGDAADTARHLLVFHLLTDVTVLFALGYAVSLVPSRASRRGIDAAATAPLHVNS